MSFQENIAYHKTYHTHSITFRVYQWSAWNSTRSVHARRAELSIEFSGDAIASWTSSNVKRATHVKPMFHSHSRSQNLLLWVVADVLSAMRAILSHFATLRLLNFADGSFSGELNYCVVSVIEFFESSLIRWPTTHDSR